MKPYVLLAALPLAALTLSQLPADAAHPRAKAMATHHQADHVFQAIATRFLAEAMRLSPVEATAMGVHKYDRLLPDVSATGRAERRQAWQGFLAQLNALKPAQLSRDNQVDLALLKNELQ